MLLNRGSLVFVASLLVFLAALADKALAELTTYPEGSKLMIRVMKVRADGSGENGGLTSLTVNSEDRARVCNLEEGDTITYGLVEPSGTDYDWVPGEPIVVTVKKPYTTGSFVLWAAPAGVVGAWSPDPCESPITDLEV